VRLPAGFALAALFAAIPDTGAAAETSPVAVEATRVAPGGVVQWMAVGEDCRIGDEVFAANAGVCWFAVDLLTPPGTRWGVRTKHGPRVMEVAPYPYPEQHIQLEDERMVSPDAASLKRIGAENERIRALWPLRTPTRFALPLAAPLADPPPGGRFGSRRVFNGQPRNAHSGADYSAKRGTPVLAVAPGTVVLAEDHYFAGKSVFVDHGDGLISMYFHLDSIAVTVGAPATTGTIVGTVGSSGRATGPHLHFGLRWRGARVDPAILLDPSKVVVLD
jgi:hypothetical protein